LPNLYIFNYLKFIFRNVLNLYSNLRRFLMFLPMFIPIYLKRQITLVQTMCLLTGKLINYLNCLNNEISWFHN